MTKGVFFPSIAASFHLDRAELSTLMSSNLLVGSLVAAAGAMALARRVTIRAVIAGGLFLVGVSYAGAALARSYAQLACAFALMNGSVVTIVAIPSFIVHGRYLRQPWMLAWALSGTTTVAVALVPLLAWVIQEHGWRAAYAGLAAVNLVLLVLTWTLLPATRAAPHPKTPRGNAWRRPLTPLSVLMASYCCYMIILSSHLVHFLVMVEDAGATFRNASLVAGAMFLLAALSKFGVGWVAEHVRPIRLLAGLFLIEGLGLLLLGTAERPLLVAAALLLYGLTFAAPTVLLPPVFVEQLGSRNFTLTYSAIGLAATAVSAAGPIFAGHMFERFGSYGSVLLSYAVAALSVGGLLWLLARRPVEQRGS